MRFKIVAAFAALVLVTASVADSDAARPGNRPGAKRQESAQETPLDISTFAHKVMLDGESGAVLSFPLPESVHKGIARRDFADICVFDAEGNPVPFQIRSPKGESSSLKVEKEVPYFVWQPEKPEAETPANLDIEINAKGGIVRIKGQTDGVPRPGPVSYLLDMQAFYDAAAAPVSQSGEKFGAADILQRVVEVNLAGDNAFMAYVTMKTSADLASWSSIGKPQVLARMMQKDVTLARDTLVLPKTAHRYLLLQLSDSEAPVFAFTAKASFGKTTLTRQESLFTGKLSENKRVVSYDIPGRFPVTAMGFDLPQTEMMAVRLLGADAPDRPFSQYASGFIYRLDKDGSAITGEPFPVKTSLRCWNLQAAGDIPFAAVPALRLFWEPRELLFLARGKGPWTLAYGRDQGVSAVASPMLDQATVVAAKIISEPAAITDTPPAPVKKDGDNGWILWAVLGLAVLFLTGIAVWLLKSMGAKKD